MLLAGPSAVLPPSPPLQGRSLLSHSTDEGTEVGREMTHQVPGCGGWGAGPCVLACAGLGGEVRQSPAAWVSREEL